jgi:hypothetical protein
MGQVGIAARLQVVSICSLREKQRSGKRFWCFFIWTPQALRRVTEIFCLLASPAIILNPGGKSHDSISKKEIVSTVLSASAFDHCP